MKYFSLLTVIFIFISYLKLSKCCSCAATHPEIQFCRADYAIKVLVLGKSVVQVDEQGNIVTDDDDDNDIKVPPPFVSGPVLVSDDTSDHSPVKGVGPPGEPLHGISADLPVALIDKKDESPSLIDILDKNSTADKAADVPSLEKPEVDIGESNIADHLKIHITTSSTNESKNKKKKDKGDNEKSRKRRRRRRRNRPHKNYQKLQRVKRQAVFAGDFAPGQQVPLGGLRLPTGMAPSSSLYPYTQYKVKVLKVFKGNQVEMETTFLYTPTSGSLCNINLNVGDSYLIMGPSRGGRLHLNWCDFKLEMKQLNDTEQRHLTNVMNHVYGKQCGECEIEVCFNREKCEHTERSYRCIWNNLYTLMDYRAYQFVCVKKKQANPPKCEWYNSLNPQSHPKDLD